MRVKKKNNVGDGMDFSRKYLIANNDTTLRKAYHDQTYNNVLRRLCKSGEVIAHKPIFQPV